MIRFIIFGIICLSLLFSIQITYAQENIEFESGKNIREWESISAALIDKDRYDEAIIYLDRILEQEPNNLKALSNKSGILIELERYDESVEIADIVLKNEPNRISALTNKAIALKMLKEYEKSYEVFTKIIILEPENETVKKARANLLSGTPTISTNESKFLVHILVTIRNDDGELIGVTESTNARFLQSKFTDGWWNLMLKEKKIINYEKVQAFQDEHVMLPGKDHIGMFTLDRDMSGYNIHLFEVFTPMIELEKSDIVNVQWTIIKN